MQWAKKAGERSQRWKETGWCTVQRTKGKESFKLERTCREPNVGKRQGGLRLGTFIAFGGEDAMGLWRGCYLTVVEVDPIVLWAKG